MLLYAPESIRSVWILSFEYSGVASLGGLGEAVRVKAEALARMGLNVTVLMPSHGRYHNQALRTALRMSEIDFVECGYRRGVDGGFYEYCLGAEEGYLNGVKIVLFKGLGEATRRIFDSWEIYSNVEEKASLFTRAVRAYAERNPLPDIVDANDWHSVMAGAALRQVAERRGIALPLVFTIHLSGSPSFPWHYASRDWSGLDDYPHLVWRPFRHEWRLYSEVWNERWGNVESFGVIESDALLTVSYSYLREELLRKHGSWVEVKSCIVYNATDIRVEDIDRYLVERYGGASKEALGAVIESLKRQGVAWGSIDDTEGLVISLGRLTWQKGFDVAVKALDYAPSAKLLILGVPVGDTGFESYLKTLVEERRGRVMVIAGKLSRKDVLAAVRLSNALIATSRWEPFGLVAAEALALGVPVVASNTGGLREIVLDARWSDEGTGLLVKPEDVVETGLAIESLIRILRGAPSHEIPIRELARFTDKGAQRIRENCIKRVDSYFRESSMIHQLRSCYEKARQMAYYRAIASGV